MPNEVSRRLDPESLDLFESKGRQGGAAIAHGGNPNAVKVRRVLQTVLDLATPTGGGLQVLDVACGEGAYSIEAALHGMDVLGVDARTERMEGGARAAQRLGLSNVRFEQHDLRRIDVSTHGQFDIIFFLGILYHLDVPDLFQVVRNIFGMCRQMVIVDTHVSLHPRERVEHDGRVYEGVYYREHGDSDPEPVRRARLLASLDNPLSYWLTRKSLVDLLRTTGFTSVLECHAPPEPFKPRDRTTLVAMKGRPVEIATYPWVNHMSEDEIERRLLTSRSEFQVRDASGSLKERVQGALNRMLRPLGCEIVPL